MSNFRFSYLRLVQIGIDLFMPLAAARQASPTAMVEISFD